VDILIIEIRIERRRVVWILTLNQRNVGTSQTAIPDNFDEELLNQYIAAQQNLYREHAPLFAMNPNIRVEFIRTDNR
jgi:hypothetical protein